MEVADSSSMHAITRIGAIVAVIAGLILVAQAIQTIGALASTPRWEYAIEAPPDDQLRQRLNALGEQGWEIVSSRRATSQESGKTAAAYELILKRPATLRTPLELPTPR